MRLSCMFLVLVADLTYAAFPPSNLIPEENPAIQQAKRSISPGSLHRRHPALPPADLVPDENPATKNTRRYPPPRSNPEYEAHLNKRQFGPDQVLQTPGPVPLWFDLGPTYYDVVQSKVADCWLAAASIAVVLASHDWMSHLFYGPDGKTLAGTADPSLAETQVMLWDPSPPRKNYLFKTSAFNQSKTEDRPGQRWWNSALVQGMFQLGTKTFIQGISDGNGTLHPLGGDAQAALSAMTGYSATSKYGTKWYGSNRNMLFDDLSKAWPLHTPILFATGPNTTEGNGFANSVLHGNHAYAVMWTTPAQTAILHNPWGLSLEANMTDILNNMERLVHLESFRTLNWTMATAGQV